MAKRKVKQHEFDPALIRALGMCYVRAAVDQLLEEQRAAPPQPARKKRKRKR